jgi:hypothetical protein
MPKPISNEKRADIIKHIQAGESKENVAKWLFIKVRTINRVLKRYNETGCYEALPNIAVLLSVDPLLHRKRLESWRFSSRKWTTETTNAIVEDKSRL